MLEKMSDVNLNMLINVMIIKKHVIFFHDVINKEIRKET